MEGHWDEFAKTLRQALELERLRAHFLEDSIRLKLVHMLLPLLGPAHIAQVREEQVHFEVEVRVQVVWLDVQLRPEQDNVVDFDFFFAVADEECF